MKILYRLVILVITLCTYSLSAQFYEQATTLDGKSRSCVKCEEGMIDPEKINNPNFELPCYCGSEADIWTFKVSYDFINHNYHQDLLRALHRKMDIAINKNLKNKFKIEFKSTDEGLNYMFKNFYAYKKTRQDLDHLQLATYPNEYKQDQKGAKIERLRTQHEVFTKRYREMRDDGGKGKEKYGDLRVYDPITNEKRSRIVDYNESQMNAFAEIARQEIGKIGFQHSNLRERINMVNEIVRKAKIGNYDHPFFQFVTDRYKEHYYDIEYPDLRYQAVAAYMLYTGYSDDVSHMPWRNHLTDNPYNLLRIKWFSSAYNWINDNSPAKFNFEKFDYHLLRYAVIQNYSDKATAFLRSNRNVSESLKKFLEQQDYNATALHYTQLVTDDAVLNKRFNYVNDYIERGTGSITFRERQFSFRWSDRYRDDLNGVGIYVRSLFNNLNSDITEESYIDNLFRTAHYQILGQFSVTSINSVFNIHGIEPDLNVNSRIGLTIDGEGLFNNRELSLEAAYTILEQDPIDREYKSALSKILRAWDDDLIDGKNPEAFFDSLRFSYGTDEPLDPIYQFYYSVLFAQEKLEILEGEEAKWCNENPTACNALALWRASSEIVHITLDGLGLIPVGGIVCDLANGVIYTIEGDALQASLSFSAAIPITGWFSTGAKYGYKTINIFKTTNKTTLKWFVNSANKITFGKSGQLRRVLKGVIRKGEHAHHIIPFELGKNELIQLAAKSKRSFHINEFANGIAVKAFRNTKHTAYNKAIENYLNIKLFENPNLTPDQAYDLVQMLIKKLRKIIEENPNVKIQDLILNLN
ncbi:hypothetical protein NBT05_12320 [Aquimarina sp. ERC-38]|uniref:hypothetical protein n=1 Tax=Aquimarina sp. ERC-38 TaxID=2949996 RepID=UPI00224676EF|nr:hypothetical protein [Aquimarina sp. ERC-38]UZO79733.1 hypothetical protein NBT05_12320 [Aquimarina sp. ERC-38]